MDKGEVSILGLNPISNRKEFFERVGVQFQEANYQENIRVAELCEVTASLYKNPANFKVVFIFYMYAHCCTCSNRSYLWK